MMRRQQQTHLMALTQLTQRLIACNAGRVLNATARLQGDITGIEHHPQRCALLPAMLLPVIGIDTQTMVNMEGQQLQATLTCKRGGKMQQHCRIETTAIGDGDTRKTTGKVGRRQGRRQWLQGHQSLRQLRAQRFGRVGG